MASDAWFDFGGVEIINMARVATRADALGIDTVWVRPEQHEWLNAAVPEGDPWLDADSTPWHDPDVPASDEFAGVLPLSVVGIDDSTWSSTTIEHVTRGGSAGRGRSSTKALVFNVLLAATTERGAAFGKAWLDRMLAGASGDGRSCTGASLTFFAHAAEDAPRLHYNRVSLTRGAIVTRKRKDSCSSTWLVTFTLTAHDPCAYGEAQERIEDLGGSVVAEPPSGGGADGSLTDTYLTCPAYNYDPVYDPEFPAMVEPPTAPNFLPDGWDVEPGMTYERFWVTTAGTQPASLLAVPIITLTTTTEARMVRITVMADDAASDEQCDVYWSAFVSYLPADVEFVIDGEQEVVYVWDGLSPNVRRADSLVYSSDARPVDWPTFKGDLKVAIDFFADSDLYEGDGDVRLAMSLVPRSD